MLDFCVVDEVVDWFVVCFYFLDFCCYGVGIGDVENGFGDLGFWVCVVQFLRCLGDGCGILFVDDYVSVSGQCIGCEGVVDFLG